MGIEGEGERRHKGKDPSRNSNLKLSSLSCHKSNYGCETLEIWRYLEVMLSLRFAGYSKGRKSCFFLNKTPTTSCISAGLDTEHTQEWKKSINICRKFSKCYKSFVTPQQSEPARFTLSPGGKKKTHTTWQFNFFFFQWKRAPALLCDALLRLSLPWTENLKAKLI